MALALLDNEEISQRTLGHDMESFFAVIIWIATLNYDDEAAFQAKPLANMMLNRRKTPTDIVNAKDSWLKNPENFRRRIVDHFEPLYRQDQEFLRRLFKLRRILYPILDLNDDEVLISYISGGPNKNDNKKTKDADPMKEGLFRTCMEEMDGYFNEKKGCDEMEWIDSHASMPHTPESLR
jgi:hypothetical protein